MKSSNRLLFSARAIVALALILSLLATVGQEALAQGGIIYVDADATGDNDGSSWADAFTTLQPALDEATATDQIWVAAGVYNPTVAFAPGDPRSVSFQLANGVALYGGFDPDAGDVAFADRDWEANPAVLSGDIGVVGDTADNVYHVFYHPDGTGLDGTAILDGFVITGGNANGGAESRWHGGGMFNYGSSPTLANCTFLDNLADNDGGGIYNDAGSAPTLIDCAFAGNSAGDDGGGVYNNAGSAPTLTGCTFTGNQANNTGGFGGGMLNNNSSPVLVDCVFWGNSADVGGGMHSASSTPILTNCIFADNTATHDGGAMYNDNSSPALTNCTFWNNSAEHGGGIFNFYSSPSLTNCILWGDTPTEIQNADLDSSPVVTYTDIQGGHPGVGNIQFNPEFVDALGGDLRLLFTSPAIDAGFSDATGLAAITTDLGGHPRRVDMPDVPDTGAGTYPIVDMGAYEAPPNPIYVDQDASGANDGSSWTDALTDLQTALTWAQDGVEVWVAEGTYRPTAGADRTASFAMVNGVGIYGGFDPDDGDIAWEDRDWEMNPTVLSGDIGVPGDSADNAYHVFYHPEGTDLDSTAILDGFTITAGNASDDTSPHRDGAGMYNHGSSPTLSNCAFTANTASHDGGGIFNNEGSAPTITNCAFSDNSAGSTGGSGGGMLNENSSPVLTNCTFSANSAALGGGMFNADSSPTLTNCAFWDNTAPYDGGAMLNDHAFPTLTNCTFWGNVADDEGGGIYNFYSSPTVTNCILWGNSPDQIYDSDVNSTPAVTYSDVQGGYPGTGNIDADPLFLDAPGGDLRLQLTSPAVDAGDSAAPGLVGITTDLGGNPRFTGVVDMGAYEAPPNPIYVDQDATGANNGSSWTDAFTDLQDALSWAQEGVEVWVAEGIYKPTAGADRAASFAMVNGAAIYGGFDPDDGDVAWEDRDWEMNPTILSGDLNGDDGPDFANNDENSLHVFYHPTGTDLDSTAILDGFVITGGNADGALPHHSGGGMHNHGSSPTITNCTFSGNSADSDGGAMFNIYSSPTLTNCTLSANFANDGGGMLNISSSPTLIDCTFSDNLADQFGGGMLNNGSVTLINCTFSGNSAYNGGGMFNTGASSPALTNCTFDGNSAAHDGGAIFNRLGSAPTITNCSFSGNSAGSTGGSGGAILNENSSPVLTDCTFSANSAALGGGMFNADSSPTLANCTFWDNTAAYDGGAMLNDHSYPILTNCTFWGNVADDEGGGIYNFYSSPIITNSILWGNAPHEIFDSDVNSTPVVTYSDVQGGYPGTGNIDADPLLANPGSGDMHLMAGSPCIDAGDNGAPNLPAYDFEGDPRIIDRNGDGTATVDMGVDEAIWLRGYLPLVFRGY